MDSDDLKLKRGVMGFARSSTFDHRRIDPLNQLSNHYVFQITLTLAHLVYI